MSAENPRGKGSAESSTDANDKELSCDDCGKEYTTVQGLIYHLKNNSCSGVECPTCSKNHFTTERGMEDHHSEVHGISFNKSETDCSYCGDTVVRYDRYLEKVPRTFCKDTNCASKWKSENIVGDRSGKYKGGKVEVECAMCNSTKEVYPWRTEQCRRHFCNQDCRSEWISQTYSGEDHPNWKGGWDWYYGPNWEQQRRKALERDNYECQYCGKHADKMDRSPDVHHLIPLREYRLSDEIDNPYERANALDNLVTSCPECHAKWEGIPLRPT